MEYLKVGLAFLLAGLGGGVYLGYKYGVKVATAAAAVKKAL